LTDGIIAADEMSVARDPRIFGVLQLPAGRGSGTSSTRDRRAAEASDAATPGFMPTSMAAEQSGSEPVVYVVWGILQESVYKHHRITDVEELR